MRGKQGFLQSGFLRQFAHGSIGIFFASIVRPPIPGGHNFLLSLEAIARCSAAATVSELQGRTENSNIVGPAEWTGEESVLIHSDTSDSTCLHIRQKFRIPSPFDTSKRCI